MPTSGDERAFSPVDEAVDAIRSGRLVLVTGGENRKNEGRLVGAAEHITPAQVNFMAARGRGLTGVSIAGQRADELELFALESRSATSHATRFAVPVDYKQGPTTGLSASDRSKTIRALADPNAKAEHFARPGHVFPLRARDGGVLRRAGHAEAALDLVRLAGCYPASALVSMMNEDGTMAQGPQLRKLSEKFGMPLISIQDLIAYRMRHDKRVERVEEVDLPTRYGHFRLVAYEEILTCTAHLALVKGTWEEEDPVLVHLHTPCVAGDLFAALHCNCEKELTGAMRQIEAAGRGVILYMRVQRGRNQINALKAYKLQQEEDLGRAAAYEALGAERNRGAYDYDMGGQMLRDLRLRKLRLLTNRPDRGRELRRQGLTVVDRVPIIDRVPIESSSDDDIDTSLLESERLQRMPSEAAE